MINWKAKFFNTSNKNINKKDNNIIINLFISSKYLR